MTSDLIGDQIRDAIREWSDNRPRSLQSSGGLLGISDVGGCRNYAALVTRKTEPSDRRKTWAADVGTAVDAVIKDAMTVKFPNAEPPHTVTCKYPNGATLPGTPDFIGDNVVVDYKTKDGLATIRKDGPPNQHWMQVNAYAKALLDEGTFDGGRDVTVVLAYLDRSGADDDVVVFTQDYNPMVLVEAGNWIDDVVYAVENNEEASKDWPINKCQSYCEFFTLCRGEDDAPDGGLITHPETVTALENYLEGMAMAKAGKALQDEAKSELIGAEGSTGQIMVKWTHVGETETPASTRRGYDKITVKRVKPSA